MASDADEDSVQCRKRGRRRMLLRRNPSNPMAIGDHVYGMLVKEKGA
jgi:hypothetical protein